MLGGIEMKKRISNFINKIKKLKFKDKKVLLVTAISVLALTALIATSFALFLRQEQSDQKDLFATGTLVVDFNDDSGNAINLDPAKPVSDDYGKTLDPYTFTITNNGSLAATYQVSLEDSSSLTTDAINLLKPVLKYQINDNTPDYLKNTNNQLLVSGVLESGESIRYSLRLWVANEATTEIENLTYTGKITLSGQATHKVKLAKQILKANSVKTTPTFAQSSTDKGIFVQKGDSTKSIDGEPTYYFKGAVENNYVKFGTYKTTDGGHTIGEPILWRIVRINEDGSIRLISENVISGNTVWNSNGTANYTNSTIKNIVDTWYTNNIGNDTKLDSKVITGNFCNDISGSYGAAYTRLSATTPTPTFICPSGGNVINEKAGLITADEIVYSGGFFNRVSTNNNITYLQNQSWFWTLTPASSSEVLWWYGDSGTMYSNSVNDSSSASLPVRAVINLDANVSIAGGDGSKSNPYFVGEIYKDESGANKPLLASGMIPVTYDSDKDVWVKADTTQKWYDYNTQMWANAVTVRDCIPKGDLNLDGVIDSNDVTVWQSYLYEENVAGTDAEIADLNGDNEITGADFTELSIAMNNPESSELCLNPVKGLKSYYSLREYYEDSSSGTEIVMDDINSMWVWIPRFKYKIATNLGSSSALTSPPQIDVVFEKGTNATGVTEAAYRAGISATSNATNTNYYTHPAFRDIDNITYSTDTTKTSNSRGAWDEELTGIWVGKFETGTNNTTCNSSASLTTGTTNCLEVDPIVKPDVKALRYQSVSTQFLTSLKFAGGTMNTSTGEVTFKGSNTYGLTASTDTHMMKNTEWGAVAYLSQSKYGKNGNSDPEYQAAANKEVYKNNSSSYITGRSSGVPPASGSTANGTYSYNDKSCTTVTTTTLGNTCTGSKTTNSGQGASTTGTVYGVYDISGGSYEYTMGNWNGNSGYSSASNSGFNGLNGYDSTTTSGISFPESKYYDLYKGSSVSTITMLKSIMGDATWETVRWYSDSAAFVYTSYPWAYRGGVYSNTSNAGVLSSSQNPGNVGNNLSFRTTLIP